MVITESEKRRHFQPCLFEIAERCEPVFDHYGVLPLGHEDRLLEYELLGGVRVDRKRVEPKFSEIAVSLRMNDVFTIFVRGEVDAFAIDHHGILELRKHHEPSHWRVTRSHEKAVVSPAVQPANRRGRIATQSIRNQPFLGAAYREVAASGFVNDEHKFVRSALRLRSFSNRLIPDG